MFRYTRSAVALFLVLVSQACAVDGVEYAEPEPFAPECARTEALDDYCALNDPERPYGFSCSSDPAELPEHCVDHYPSSPLPGGARCCGPVRR